MFLFKLINLSCFKGGSIINERTVLTAAHCVSLVPARNFVVRVGVSNLREANSQNTYQASKVILRSSVRGLNFVRPTDIAIIKLKRPIRFTTGKVEPACYDLSNKNYGNSQLMVRLFKLYNLYFGLN